MGFLKLAEGDQKALGRAMAQLEDKTRHRAMVVADLFALGCFLMSTGQRVAGRKACLTVLRSLDLTGALRERLLEKACAEPGAYHDLFSPHNELLELFRRPTAAA